MNFYYLLFFLFICWLLLLPAVLYLMSENIAILGIYHTTNSEKSLERFKKVLMANTYISLPFIASYYIVIDNTVQNIDFIYKSCLTLVITLVSILSIRLLANPVEIIKPGICKFCTSEDENDSVMQYKERIIAFFHSFICAALILLLIIFSASVFSDSKFILPDNIYSQQILIGFVFYVGGLILLTVVGEFILNKYEPIIQIKK